jgi:hypothetical protein
VLVNNAGVGVGVPGVRRHPHDRLRQGPGSARGDDPPGGRR